jgi:hypothetical protein
MIENARKTIENARERSGTVNAHEPSGTVRNGHERSGTVNDQEHIGTIELERSNALERIVENGHGTVTVRSRSRSKNESNTVFYCYFSNPANFTVSSLGASRYN